ncbi:sensor histidine kinase [Krasilnikovia sp. MM14-A1259]|uniref:sensor histidine kinase n=1 Tax=Krasilnikovia sp. MM14-A1259 TaxID=3373539 RepID=UPI0038244DAD
MTAAHPADRGSRYGWAFAAIWMFYLGENLHALLHHPGGWARTVGLAALAGFAVLYLVAVSALRVLRRDMPSRLVQDPPAPAPHQNARLWAYLIALLVLAALQIPGAGHHALTCSVYIAAVAMMGLPLAQAVPFAAVLALVTELSSRLVPGWEDNGYGLAVLFACVATYGIRLAAERQRRLHAAQQELANLAVATERARIAADLHDILGHSLTVVAVKAELAQRLLDVDLDKARTELHDLEKLARDALSDVRATALGVRGISLPGEIAAARQALAAAHVAADLPGAADEVPSNYRELFAWTIREAVTNVVRHAHAGHVEVRLTPASVEILDDGVGGQAPPADGQGLRGLRRRAEALGATVTVGRREDTPGFRVRVEVPT